MQQLSLHIRCYPSTQASTSDVAESGYAIGQQVAVNIERYGETPMLKFTITDTPSEQRITLGGKLIGPWIQELRRV